MDSKRQRLGEGAAPPDDSSQLSHVLGKLTALVTQGAGDAEGLDDLLEQLGRLQAKLNGASEPAFKAIEDAQARLQVQRPRSQGRRRCRLKTATAATHGLCALALPRLIPVPLCYPARPCRQPLWRCRRSWTG